jgi:hypothetical protein
MNSLFMGQVIHISVKVYAIEENPATDFLWPHRKRVLCLWAYSIPQRLWSDAQKSCRLVDAQKSWSNLFDMLNP